MYRPRKMKKRKRNKKRVMGGTLHAVTNGRKKRTGRGKRE